MAVMEDVEVCEAVCEEEGVSDWVWLAVSVWVDEGTPEAVEVAVPATVDAAVPEALNSEDDGVEESVIDEEVDGVEERVNKDDGDALKEHDFVTTLNEGHPVVPYVIVPTMAEVSAQREPP